MTLTACYRCNSVHSKGQPCGGARWGGRRVQSVRRRIAARDEYTCQECGAPTPLDGGHVDHVVPRAMGGSDGDQNLRWLCEPCNLRKGNS